MVTYIELKNFIRAKLPTSQIKTRYEGKEPNSDIDRYSITVIHNNISLLFKLGANILFYLEETPRAILKLQALIPKKEIQNFVNKCIDNINTYLKSEKVPAVQNYARRYLGQEEKVESREKATYIYYDKIFIVVTPEIILVVEKATKRTVRVFELENEDLDKIFREIKYYLI